MDQPYSGIINHFGPHHLVPDSRGGCDGDNLVPKPETHEYWHVVCQNLLPSEVSFRLERECVDLSTFRNNELLAWERLGFVGKSSDDIAEEVRNLWTPKDILQQIRDARQILFDGTDLKTAEQRLLAGYYTYYRHKLSLAQQAASKMLFGTRPDRFLRQRAHGTHMKIHDKDVCRSLQVLKMNFSLPYRDIGFTVGMLDLTLPQRFRV